MKKEQIAKEREKDYLEAHRAMQQANALIKISQEAFTGPEGENVYNLLDLLGEKINIGLNFFDNNDPYLKGEKS